MANLIHLTDRQREAVGQIVADNFGANFQTGFTDKKDHVYVGWRRRPNDPVRSAKIAPDGTITYV